MYFFVVVNQDTRDVWKITVYASVHLINNELFNANFYLHPKANISVEPVKKEQLKCNGCWSRMETFNEINAIRKVNRMNKGIQKEELLPLYII